jgi:hypothetical protein
MADLAATSLRHQRAQGLTRGTALAPSACTGRTSCSWLSRSFRAAFSARSISISIRSCSASTLFVTCDSRGGRLHREWRKGEGSER